MKPGEAQAAEREALAAIGELGLRELDAVKAWVASGCEGPKPQPDHDERERLAAALKAAIGPQRGVTDEPSVTPSVRKRLT
jgi:hypothetical protein